MTQAIVSVDDRQRQPLAPISIEEAKLHATQSVELARHCSILLMDIVREGKLYQELNGKKYLYYEAWSTIGMFYKVKAKPTSITPIRNDEGQIIAYEAEVHLVNESGISIGSGIMQCGLDEFVCRGKTGEAKVKAAKSAAQTWAASKAYRLNYSHVVVMAGYEATPYEEMESAPPSVPTPKEASGWPTPKAAMRMWAAPSGPAPKPPSNGSDAPLCPTDGHGPNRLQPAGVAQGSGKPYPPFYTCASKGCNLKPQAINKAMADEYNAAQAADAFAPATILTPDSPEEEPDNTTEELFI